MGVTRGGEDWNQTFSGFVRFEQAEAAIATLDGSQLHCKTIQVTQHESLNDEKTKLKVSGFPYSVDWKCLKDYFARCGEVGFADVDPPPGAEFGPKGVGKGKGLWYDGTGIVRYEDPAHAAQAIAQFNGATIFVQQHHELNPEGTKLVITGLPHFTSWWDLKDWFGCVGPIAFTLARW